MSSPSLPYPRLSQSEIASRVLAVCKAFDKITADKLTLDSHFIKVTLALMSTLTPRTWAWTAWTTWR